MYRGVAHIDHTTTAWLGQPNLLVCESHWGVAGLRFIEGACINTLDPLDHGASGFRLGKTFDHAASGLAGEARGQLFS